MPPKKIVRTTARMAGQENGAEFARARLARDKGAGLETVDGGIEEIFMLRKILKVGIVEIELDGLPS